MTNDLLTPLTDIGALLILLCIASVITGATLFAIEGLRRTVLKATDADGPARSPAPQKRRQLPGPPELRHESVA